MPKPVVCLALAVLGIAVSQAAVFGRSIPPSAFELAAGTEGPLLTANAVLRASIDRIARKSQLWREATDAVRESGRFALVLTPEQVVVADAAGEQPLAAFDTSVVAEVSPLPDEDSRVSVVLVVVNVPLVEEFHRRRDSLPGECQADLDRIVTHEVYGHAMPYLLAGHLSGRCADPAPGERASDACSIRRENAVRKELGLGRRTDYGLGGLALARRAWDSSFVGLTEPALGLTRTSPDPR